jgi:hypothetical protein
MLKRGGSMIAVKCSEGDSTQECVDAVKDLMSAVADSMPPRWRHGDGPRPGPSDRPDRQDQPEMPDGSDQ